MRADELLRKYGNAADSSEVRRYNRVMANLVSRTHNSRTGQTIYVFQCSSVSGKYGGHQVTLVTHNNTIRVACDCPEYKYFAEYNATSGDYNWGSREGRPLKRNAFHNVPCCHHIAKALLELQTYIDNRSFSSMRVRFR